MGKEYVIEVGLDANAQARPDGTYPLVTPSLGVLEGSTWKPHWFEHMHGSKSALDQSSFTLRVCDYTDLSATSSNYKVSGVFVQFVRADDRITVVPTGDIFPDMSDPVILGLDTPVNPGHPSIVFPSLSQNLTWYFATKINGEVVFLLPEKARAILCLQVFTIWQTQSGTYELRIYNDDPEIFIGEGLV